MFHIASDEKLQGGPGDEAREMGVLICLVGASIRQYQCPAKTPDLPLICHSYYFVITSVIKTSQAL